MSSDMEDIDMECLKADIVRHLEGTPKDTDRVESWFGEDGRAYMVGVTKAESNEFEIPEHCDGLFADSFEALLRSLLPPTIAGALIEHEDNPDFVAARVRQYLEGDRDVRNDMLATFEAQSPEMVRQSIVKDEEGTPTAADLEELFNQTTEEE